MLFVFPWYWPGPCSNHPGILESMPKIGEPHISDGLEFSSVFL